MPICEIMDGLFFIERGYLNGNHFVYRSPRPVLIDTGYVSDFSETQRLIGELGVNLSDISLVVNTHCHCDHVGGNRLVQEKSGCDIAMHRIGKHFIDTRDDWSTWWRYYNQEAHFFTCTTSLKDGDTLAIGPHQFQVIYTPGHASDGIALYNRKDKALVSSDALWENDMAVLTVRVEGSRALFSHLESLERLESLDVRVVYPGHGPPFTDMKKAISRARRKIEDYMRSREKLGDDLLKRMFTYTLLMKRGVDSEGFFPLLMGTNWFRETVDLYFGGEYEAKYAQVTNGLLQRGILKEENNRLFTTVRP
ncbi:MAG: MBL fold metallo-hydrolase [Chloroflexi bacterium]|nr:MBL fold metallo-hydrolase [Chloroflexota bacterium]